MGRQFLVWFGAALLGGIVLVVAGGFWRHGGPSPKRVDAMMSTPPGNDAAQHMLDATALPAPAGRQVLARGDGVPADYALPDLDGQPQALAQWHGKRVLLNFWATWCAPCREEMPALAEAQRRYGAKVQVVGIAIDDPVAVRAYLKKTPVNYPVLIGLGAEHDPTMLFGDTRGALPYSVLVGPDGRIKGTHLGKLDERQLRWWLE
jgi:thiol-disulfide isomerase/thioredoxin